MKIGDKVHVVIKNWKAEWDGTIVADLSYLGDGRRKVWGVDKVESLSKWNKQGSIAISEEDLINL